METAEAVQISANTEQVPQTEEVPQATEQPVKVESPREKQGAGQDEQPKSPSKMTEEEKEAYRQKRKYEGYIPPEKRRPPDEFFDLKTMRRTCMQVVQVNRDSTETMLIDRTDPRFPYDEDPVLPEDQIIKFVLQRGAGTLIQNTDDVYYKHETRHDNGQLVDFSERRKVDEKFEMKNPCFHEHYKIVLRGMQRGEAAYVRYPKWCHQMAHHKSQHFINKTPEEKAGIGEDIYIRFHISKVKRTPICKDNETFEGLMDYLERIREVAKELMEEKEYINARGLYCRILPMFKNMPRKLRDGLNEAQNEQRIEAHQILLMNISLCYLKVGLTIEAVKFAKEAVEVREENPKALYRLASAQKANGDFEPARETIIKAIKLAPSDPALRKEYESITEVQNAKRREWFSKMNGFLHSEKMREVEKKDEEERLLKEKLFKKQGFDWPEDDGNKDW